MLAGGLVPRCRVTCGIGTYTRKICCQHTLWCLHVCSCKEHDSEVSSQNHVRIVSVSDCAAGVFVSFLPCSLDLCWKACLALAHLPRRCESVLSSGLLLLLGGGLPNRTKLDLSIVLVVQQADSIACCQVSQPLLPSAAADSATASYGVCHMSFLICHQSRVPLELQACVGGIKCVAKQTHLLRKSLTCYPPGNSFACG